MAYEKKIILSRYYLIYRQSQRMPIRTLFREYCSIIVSMKT